MDFQTTEDKGKGTLNIEGKIESNETDRVKILDEFLTITKVDLNAWEVERYVVNAWDVTMKMKRVNKDDTAAAYTNYQIKVWLKKKIIDIEATVKRYIDMIPEFKYSTELPKFEPGSGIALEVAPLDAHLGKLSWLLETTYRNYDVNIAAQDYTYAVDQFINWGAIFSPEKIFYIVGQDLYHMDNMAGKTTGGEHSMDVDGRITKVHDKVFDIVIKSIYKLRNIAPVEIIWSPGNHDYLMSYMLCLILKEHFRNDQFVTVDVSKANRKARLWGNLLVGWTHQIIGRYNSWSNELAQAFPELWGQSRFREWHHGDQHKKQDVKVVPTFTSGGVICRQLTALSPVDRWHTENLYTDAVPGGEAFLWSKDHGVFANFSAWTGQYERSRNEIIKNHTTV